MYDYQVTRLVNVIGNRAELEVDLGFRVISVQRVRLIGVEAPDVNEYSGNLQDVLNAGEFVENWFMNAALPVNVMIQKGQRDAFGEWHGRVLDGEGNELVYPDVAPPSVDSGTIVPTWEEAEGETS